MSIERKAPAELLALDKFNVDEEEPHIILDKAVCAACPDKPCLYVCPAVLYRLDKNGELTFDYAGCLECGTCRAVCARKGIIKWVYPRGTFGVSFRQG
jgi:ferredoxin like protein